MKMPMGVYEGRAVESLPTKYLAWLVTQDAIRFKRWPLAKEALRVLRDRFQDLETLEADLKVENAPPEYWKTAKGREQIEKRKAEKAEKLRALEQRRAEERERRRAERRAARIKAELEMQAAFVRSRRGEPPPDTIIDASYYARQARQKPADPNDVSDLL